ncbi:hypothetical protein C8T65DRAFT_75174 [Cerioporus squamosus]|nr:hypothetical protein C8T65DRAFT_75174 [Cerioporus squamosus]
MRRSAHVWPLRPLAQVPLGTSRGASTAKATRRRRSPGLFFEILWTRFGLDSCFKYLNCRPMPPGEKQKELHALEVQVLPASTTGTVISGRRSEGRTIQDVPVELLLEIFRILATHCKDSNMPTAWMGVLLVCSYWYRVACDASELWRVIHVGSNTDWLRLCLQRSARSLVDVHFCGLPTTTVDAAIPLIVPHAQRIRALHLTGHGRLSADIFAFFARPLPALEELSVLPAEWRSLREAELVPWAQGFRGMRSLALSGVSVPRDPAFYRNMRALELHERCCQASGFTIDDLILALDAAASTLEELDLSRFEPIFPEHPPSLLRARSCLPSVSSSCAASIWTTSSVSSRASTSTSRSLVGHSSTCAYT